eukprot:scaffold7941_cov390-Prasinococcus_capsulatus_cf.AAC.1
MMRGIARGTPGAAGRCHIGRGRATPGRSRRGAGKRLTFIEGVSPAAGGLATLYEDFSPTPLRRGGSGHG